MPRVLEQRFVEIALVTRGYEDGIKVHRLRPLRGIWHIRKVERAPILHMETDSVFPHRRLLNIGHKTIWQNPMGPVFLGFCRVPVLYPLEVKCLVNVLQQVESYDPVIGSFVLSESRRPSLGFAVKSAVYPRWVENLIESLDWANLIS